MFRKIETGDATAGPVSVTIDGNPLLVEEGEPVAAILLRTPPFIHRLTPVTGTARSAYCMMGACFDCLAEIDGRTSTRACLTRARAGMTITRQMRRPDPDRDVAP